MGTLPGRPELGLPLRVGHRPSLNNLITRSVYRCGDDEKDCLPTSKITLRGGAYTQRCPRSCSPKTSVRGSFQQEGQGAMPGVGGVLGPVLRPVRIMGEGVTCSPVDDDLVVRLRRPGMAEGLHVGLPPPRGGVPQKGQR